MMRQMLNIRSLVFVGTTWWAHITTSGKRGNPATYAIGLQQITIGDDIITYHILKRSYPVKRGYITVINSHTAPREKL